MLLYGDSEERSGRGELGNPIGSAFHNSITFCIAAAGYARMMASCRSRVSVVVGVACWLVEGQLLSQPGCATWGEAEVAVVRSRGHV